MLRARRHAQLRTKRLRTKLRDRDLGLTTGIAEGARRCRLAVVLSTLTRYPDITSPQALSYCMGREWSVCCNDADDRIQTDRIAGRAKTRVWAPVRPHTAELGRDVAHRTRAVCGSSFERPRRGSSLGSGPIEHGPDSERVKVLDTRLGLCQGRTGLDTSERAGRSLPIGRHEVPPTGSPPPEGACKVRGRGPIRHIGSAPRTSAPWNKRAGAGKRTLAHPELWTPNFGRRSG